ncbi:MAG: class I SAM-dependent methyltransferase [Boseongicola sp.]
MTDLAGILTRQIREAGPITVAEYMANCLQHPTHGYYTSREPFGASGDFTTAPEISQMFGELLGLALGQSWRDRGAPSKFNLVEFGPGRGTLLSDILRAAAQFPGFADAAEIHLVETSPVLREVQSKTIDAPVVHHDTLESIPAGPFFLVANEFFDALPIRQFVRDGDSWRERVVGLDDNNKLSFGLSDVTDPEFLRSRLEDTSAGDLVEYSLQAEMIADKIGRRICRDNGVAMIMDYGNWRSLGDTLQAIRRHRPVSSLELPGEADVTAHVDFETIAAAAAPAQHSELTPQGVFLERLGITARAQVLARGLTEKALESHIAAHRRLTHPDEMGNLFKVMAVFAPDTPVPPGLGP